MVTAGDLYAELDRAIVAVSREQRDDRPVYDKNYLFGIRDGLCGFRAYIRSNEFDAKCKRGSNAC